MASMFIVKLTVHLDIAETLLDLKESDVGVLASGPRKMRDDVAKICASGLAQNLHFESISFTL